MFEHGFENMFAPTVKTMLFRKIIKIHWRCVCVFPVFRDVRRGSLAASPRSTKKRRTSSNTIGHMCKNGVGAQPVLRACFGQPAAQKVTTNQPCHVKAFIGPTGAQMTSTKCQI